MSDLISRQAAIDATWEEPSYTDPLNVLTEVRDRIEALPPAQPEIIRCRDCKYYKDITSIHGECECGEMWQSLFGEVTEVEAIEVHKDHYCGYAERRTDERTD